MINKIVVGFLFGFVINAGAESKIYKYVDEDGTIHYTEKKPFADSKEAKIRPITIVESSKTEPSTTRRRLEHIVKQEAAKVPKFIMTSPAPGSTLWGTGGNVLASVNSDVNIANNHRIKFFLDGSPHGMVKSNSQLIADVVRGEHKIYAQLIDTNTRAVIKTTEVITFYLMQKSKK